jgi:hypothetical protein
VDGLASRFCGSRAGFGASESLAYKLGFVILKRAGMCFFLGDTDLGQHVKNGFALDLQLTGQIIDSNLHSLLFLILSRLLRPMLTLAYLASRRLR